MSNRTRIDEEEEDKEDRPGIDGDKEDRPGIYMDIEDRPGMEEGEDKEDMPGIDKEDDKKDRPGNRRGRRGYGRQARNR